MNLKESTLSQVLFQDFLEQNYLHLYPKLPHGPSQKTLLSLDLSNTLQLEKMTKITQVYLTFPINNPLRMEI